LVALLRSESCHLLTGPAAAGDGTGKKKEGLTILPFLMGGRTEGGKGKKTAFLVDI